MGANLDRNGLPANIPEGGRPDMYRPRNRSSVTGHGSQLAVRNGPEEQDSREVQNQRAMEVLARVKEKLTGRDFNNDTAYKVDMQVDRLIREATNLENLCQHYIGWCSFW
jgi:FKBP12-rapamycin complex-associated protein